MDPDPKTSLADLASLLETNEHDLVRLSGRAPRLYRCWSEQKKSGGFRQIEAPYPPLKLLQQKLAERLLNKLPVDVSIHGKPGTSQISAALKHVGQHTILTMDIKNFFPSVGINQIRRTLTAHGFCDPVVTILCRLCTRKKRLPQGAPTSPTLARLVVSPAISRIRSATRQAGGAVRVTQYVDDLAVSGPDGIQRFQNLITRVFRQYGLSVSTTKTRVMRGTDSKEVLGLKVNTKLEVTDRFAQELAEARSRLPAKDSKRLGKEAWKRRVDREAAKAMKVIPL